MTDSIEAYSKFQDGGRASGSAPAAKTMPEHLVKVWLVEYAVHCAVGRAMSAVI